MKDIWFQMKNKLLERVRDYFYIPPKAKLEISKKNIKICTIAVYCLLVFGVVFLLREYLVFYPDYGFIYLLYYASFIFTSVLFLVISRINKKKENYYINQALIILTCSFVCLLMYLNIVDGLDIPHVVNFYFAIVVMILTFELTPFFYTIAIIIFCIEAFYFDSISPDFNMFFQVNNGLFCSALIFFSFYKRRMISVREKNRQEIEDKNRQLSVQIIELSHQTGSLLINTKNLENAAFNQSQALQLQKERIIGIQNNTIMSLSNLVENRDEDTGDHVLRTRDYVRLIVTSAYLTGDFPELNEGSIELFIKAAPMHDIGKIVVPDAILKKPGKLTPEEFELIKLHTTKGGKIVSDVLGNAEDEEYVRTAKEIATYHHEKYDGSGYPYGLKGEEIPLSARVMAIADVFDALVSPRCYKEPMPEEKAFSIIKESAGTHFDPELVSLFLEAKDEIIEIKNRYYEK